MPNIIRKKNHNLIRISLALIIITTNRTIILDKRTFFYALNVVKPK